MPGKIKVRAWRKTLASLAPARDDGETLLQSIQQPISDGYRLWLIREAEALVLKELTTQLGRQVFRHEEN